MEIIAVIAIVSVLFTVMMPGFQKMLKGNAVDQMASQVKLMIEKAQSQAVTTRRAVAVIFPNGNGWPLIDGKECRLGGARLAYVTTTRNSGTCEFVSWIADEEWRFPVEGASLVAVVDNNNSHYGSTDIANVLGNSNSHGNASLGSLSLDLWNITNYPDGNATRNDCALVISSCGEIYNPPVKFHIAETMIDQDTGTIFYPDGVNGFPANFVTLKIHPFSGEVEYVQQN